MTGSERCSLRRCERTNGRGPSANFKDKFRQEDSIAKKRKRKYSPGVWRDVEREMRRYQMRNSQKRTWRKAGKVKSRKQAIAIALSEARKEGKRVPKKK